MNSVWYESVREDRDENGRILEPFDERRTDVLIIGAGMAGVLCSLLLKEAGILSMVVEAKTLGDGVTKNTTAKITAQHALIYDRLIKKKGIEKAGQYYDIQEKALSEYRRLAQNIDCDLEEKTAYVFEKGSGKKLEKEMRAYDKLGIPMDFQEAPPLPFKTVGALGMKGQAQFNPMKFILGAAKDLDIYEGVFVSDISKNIAYTGKGRIVADSIVLATHFPMVNIPGLYFLKMYQSRSYVLGLKGGPDMGGMYIDENEKGNSFRNYGNLLLLGGGSHRTGRQGGGFVELRNLAKSAYPQAEETYFWATQDCITLDGIPYVGQHRKSNPSLYVMTGFNKWGMTGTMAAAMVVRDMIAKGKSEYEELFNPSRSIFRPQLLSNGGHAIYGLLSFGKRCTHMGCALRWNSQERSWDCSCHGSRFDENGKVQDNPAKRNLSKIR
ncbi:MAG: FAD-dependent oxidoreductase [Anaerovoracaceae bacterium]